MDGLGGKCNKKSSSCNYRVNLLMNRGKEGREQHQEQNRTAENEEAPTTPNRASTNS